MSLTATPVPSTSSRLFTTFNSPLHSNLLKTIFSSIPQLSLSLSILTYTLSTPTSTTLVFNATKGLQAGESSLQSQAWYIDEQGCTEASGSREDDGGSHESSQHNDHYDSNQQSKQEEQEDTQVAEKP